MSFHPRKYYEEHEEYFSTAEFKDYLAYKTLYEIVKKHLIKNPDLKIERGDITGVRPCEVEPVLRKLREWQEKFPELLKNKKFEKWIEFLMNEQLKQFEAKKVHLKNEKTDGITWSHAKINTMKLFFNDRDEEPRDLEHLGNDKKLKIVIDFIKQMSNKITSRYFDKSIKERVLTPVRTKFFQHWFFNAYGSSK